MALAKATTETTNLRTLSTSGSFSRKNQVADSTPPGSKWGGARARPNPKSEGPIVYINVGGLDTPEGSRPPHESLDGYSIKIVGTWEYDGWLRTNGKKSGKKSGQNTSKSLGSSALGEKVASTLLSKTNAADPADKVFSTIGCVVKGAAMWNQSFRVAVPQDPVVPDSLRFDLVASGRLSSNHGNNAANADDHRSSNVPAGDGGSWSVPIVLGAARVALDSNMSPSSLSEEIHLAQFTKVALSDALVQEAQSHRDTDDATELSIEKLPATSNTAAFLVPRRGSTGQKKIPDQVSSAVDALNQGVSRRISLFNQSGSQKRSDTSSVAALLHAAMPNDLEIGVAVVKNPTKLGMIESVWEMRRLNHRTGVI
jgi:hypothetical protein